MKKVPLRRNSINRCRDHSELSEINTKKTNIKLLLIENLLVYTRFNPSPFKVVERNGNSVVVDSDQGVQYQ